MTDLDDALRAFVHSRRVPIFAIVPAETVGEEREGWRPADILPGCRSIVLAGGPFLPFPLPMPPETNVADQAWWDANEPAFSAIHRVREKLATILFGWGYWVAFGSEYRHEAEPLFFSYRRVQAAAGISVWARYGVMIRPDYGSNYCTCVLLTDAPLSPTPPEMLPDSFDPCAGCHLCADVCPSKAIDPDVNPPACYHNERCGRYVQGKRRNVEAQYHLHDAKVCGRCHSVCPWGSAFALAHPERFLWSAHFWQLEASG